MEVRGVPSPPRLSTAKVPTDGEGGGGGGAAAANCALIRAATASAALFAAAAKSASPSWLDGGGAANPAPAGAPTTRFVAALTLTLLTLTFSPPSQNFDAAHANAGFAASTLAAAARSSASNALLNAR